ncbi:substrate-binding periplasmic protein [Thioalkalivibrio thiocyanodenitrificans]|uniref:substrate-binding periplasmic protein n=1 Tax=Thioalkalivibrio thiocyanodenitrificans TaxID=243063 RepID=UPI000373289E|nr:ABC transporter substrate-binding protein [Thioalkalivibrio thiocyanodenitrificans]
MRPGSARNSYLFSRCMAGLALLVAGLVAAHAQAQSAPRDLNELRWITEEYAPYNFTQDGVVTGLAVDILVRMWERLGVDKTAADIQSLPWARGYRMALDQPDTCLFSTTVTDTRREQFQFIEPILDANVSVIAARSHNLKADSVRDLEPYSIGVVREDIGDQLLQEGGFSGIYVRTDSARILMRMLQGQRFDGAAYNIRVADWTMLQEGIDPELYEPVLTLQEGHMGYACHRDIDAALIAQLQAALDALIEDGTVDAIIQGYLQ